ncbi:hypothetical protein V3C41_00010 [Paenarthrobacter nicotinovorans]|uniref:Phage tail protein n=1 Tax=Paenarthrobacter nicotinovorans TaxID=29320 RepID=A0ABV0GLP4_PAENI
MDRSIVFADPGGVMRRHFVEWCAKFDISPVGDRFETSSGRTAYPAHAITEPDGHVWLSGLIGLEQAGILGHVEKMASFRHMLREASEMPENCPDGLTFVINGSPFQVIFQNSDDTGGSHIINVAFIRTGR